MNTPDGRLHMCVTQRPGRGIIGTRHLTNFSLVDPLWDNLDINLHNAKVERCYDFWNYLMISCG